MAPFAGQALLLIIVSGCALVFVSDVPCVVAVTAPDTLAKISAFRDAMKTRSPDWSQALQSWTCPTAPANSAPPGTCDPCGMKSDGNWLHMHCRGNSRGWGESGDGAKTGLITNMHITNEGQEGPVPREFCILPTLREFDFNGAHYSGPIPRWLGTCFPKLEELDLSDNRLTGPLPDYIADMAVLTEVKVEFNQLVGTIPPAYGRLQLRRFQVESNHMWGPIPDSFRNLSSSIAQLHLANNNFNGNLSALADSHLTTVTVHNNPQLCGMVPSSVRYAKNYNPLNTKLGQPCPTGASSR